jgi:hypothetical protein
MGTGSTEGSTGMGSSSKPSGEDTGMQKSKKHKSSSSSSGSSSDTGGGNP